MVTAKCAPRSPETEQFGQERGPCPARGTAPSYVSSRRIGFGERRREEESEDDRAP